MTAAVTWQAATLPGREHHPNQDRCGAWKRDGAVTAVVIDGASSSSDARPDGGDYAAALLAALEVVDGGQPLTDLLDEAIAVVCGELSLPAASAPSAAVALIRVSADRVDVAVLGDCVVVVETAAGTERVTDDRLERVGSVQRVAYQKRLRRGFGFADEPHRQLLAELRQVQGVARNTPAGYYIAADDPSAARHAVVRSFDRRPGARIALATDGAADGPDVYAVPASWQDVLDSSTLDVLHRVSDAEASDPDGMHWPRGKRHDDKTLLVVSL